MLTVRGSFDTDRHWHSSKDGVEVSVTGGQAIRTDSASASYASCVRMVADGVDGHTLAESVARGPLNQLGIIQSALFWPLTDTRHGQAWSLTLVGHYCVPGLDPAPRSVTMHVMHPARQAFQAQEVGDWSMRDFALEFPLMSGYCDQLLALGHDLSRCRVLALPIEYQAVTHGVVTLLATEAPNPWSWSETELLRGTVSLVAVWSRLAQATNLLAASGILGPRRPGRSVQVSDRQLSILQALNDGKSNTSIAAALGFSISTIKQDIQRLQVMLGARNRHEVVQRALEVGLLPAA